MCEISKTLNKITLASSYGFSAVELRELANVIKRKKDLIEDQKLICSKILPLLTSAEESNRV